MLLKHNEIVLRENLALRLLVKHSILEVKRKDLQPMYR